MLPDNLTLNRSFGPVCQFCLREAVLFKVRFMLKPAFLEPLNLYDRVLRSLLLLSQVLVSQSDFDRLLLQDALTQL
jgi:hypothetical protein